MSLAQDIPQAIANFALLNQFINGGVEADVQTAGGAIPSLAKLAANIAAAVAAGLTTSSSTSLAFGTGTKVFTVQAGKSFKPGQWVTATAANGYMSGSVASYAGTTLTLNVTRSQGTTTAAAWAIVFSGAPGQQGIQGPPGEEGGSGGGASKVLITKFDWE